MNRPLPPDSLFENALEPVFLPALDVAAWARGAFIDSGATLENPEHEHLQQAEIGFVWTNEANERRGRLILGTAQMLPPSGDKWSVGRACAQLREWFGDLPNFLIILYAPAALAMDDASFCALVEHELLHCGQRRDENGAPMFSRETGEPLWTMMPHSVEEFTSVVRRYGATSPELAEMVAAVNRGPEVSAAQLAVACGVCMGR